MHTIDDFITIWEKIITEASQNKGDGKCIERARELLKFDFTRILYVIHRNYDFHTMNNAPSLQHKKNHHIGRWHATIEKDGNKIYDPDHGKFEWKTDYLKNVYHNHQNLQFLD
ncbi:MAG: hypothetical protein AABW92_00710 [Nanoarchaeota archaeon]